MRLSPTERLPSALRVTASGNDGPPTSTSAAPVVMVAGASSSTRPAKGPGPLSCTGVPLTVVAPAEESVAVPVPLITTVVA